MIIAPFFRVFANLGDLLCSIVLFTSFTSEEGKSLMSISAVVGIPAIPPLLQL